MSTRFDIYCPNHDIYGPQVARSAGGTKLIHPDQWGAFLIKHEWCGELELHREGQRGYWEIEKKAALQE